MLKPLSDAPISFGHLVRTLARHVDRAMALRVTEHGLTIAEYYVLRELYIEDGLIQRELSSRLNLTEPAMLLTVRGMYEKKLVRRVRDASDRRKINVFLAVGGKRLQAPLHDHALAVNALARAGLSDAQIVRFRATLDRMSSNFRLSGGSSLG
jgi:DNA-binding MarR family transcriptional regulator